MKALSFSSRIRAPLTSVTSHTNHRSLLNPRRLLTPRRSLLTAPRAPRITHHARQVLNIRSCIHVASEFIAPEHISHCVRITEEIRQLPATHHRHTDVLNVRSLLVSRRAPQTPTARRQTRRLFVVLPCCSALLLSPLVMPASTGSCLRPPSRAFPSPSLANASHGCAPAVLHGLRLLACAGGGQAQEGQGRWQERRGHAASHRWSSRPAAARRHRLVSNRRRQLGVPPLARVHISATSLLRLLCDATFPLSFCPIRGVCRRHRSALCTARE